MVVPKVEWVKSSEILHKASQHTTDLPNIELVDIPKQTKENNQSSTNNKQDNVVANPTKIEKKSEPSNSTAVRSPSKYVML